MPGEFGKCDHANQCRAHVHPSKGGYQNTAPGYRPPPPEPKLMVISRPGEPFDHEKHYFMMVNPFDSTEAGNLSKLSFTALKVILNVYLNTTGKKTDNPAILKGLFKGGNAGMHCIKSVPFLWWDIDCKDENEHLKEPTANAKVFEAMKKASILSWRSHSGTGMAGMLHVPVLSTATNETRHIHLKVARAIYRHLEKHLLAETGITVHFDDQQGKFRQIRYLAAQKEERQFNPDYLTFVAAKTEPTATKKVQQTPASPI